MSALYPVKPIVDSKQPYRIHLIENHIGVTMAQKFKTTSFSADPPPSYAEAMAYVQLFPGHLTQVMVDQQCSSLQNNSAETDQDEAFAKEQRKKKNNTIGWWILQLAVFIFLTFVVIWIACLSRQALKNIYSH